MSVQGRKHYVNLEGGTPAYGRDVGCCNKCHGRHHNTVCHQSCCWTQWQRLRKVQVKHLEVLTDLPILHMLTHKYRSCYRQQRLQLYSLNDTTAPPVSKPELSWIVAARDSWSLGAWESQFTHKMNWVSTHQDVWIHWRARHHLWGSWPWPHHEGWWNTEGDHTSCPIYPQPPGFSAH